MYAPMESQSLYSLTHVKEYINLTIWSAMSLPIHQNLVEGIMVTWKILFLLGTKPLSYNFLGDKDICVHCGN